MTIKTHDVESFTITTSKFGVELGQHTLRYADLGMSEANAQAKWACRNGFSQAMTDAHASDTLAIYEANETKALAAAQASVADWIASIQSGHVPIGTGGSRSRLTPYETGLRLATVNWLVESGMKKAAATKRTTSKAIGDIVMELAIAYVDKHGGSPGSEKSLYDSRMAKLDKAAKEYAKLLAPVVKSGDF